MLLSVWKGACYRVAVAVTSITSILALVNISATPVVASVADSLKPNQITVRQNPPDGERNWSVATWNMQGNGAGTSNGLWSTVQNMITTGQAEILALQEAGNDPPGSADDTPDNDLPDSLHGGINGHTIQDQNGAQWRVQIRDWTLSRQQTVRIVFLSPGQQRNGLAVIVPSTLPIRAVRIVWPHEEPPVQLFSQNRPYGATRERPALGVEVGPHDSGDPGNTTFWSVHAASGGGGNAAGYVFQINCHYATGHWMLLGDFNRNPGDLDDPRNGADSARTRWIRNSEEYHAVICPPNAVTRPASAHRLNQGMLDYLVRGYPGAGSDIEQTTGTVLDALGSDHRAVVYLLALLLAIAPPSSG
ncbi:endonuclease/exonuclease/phosphatase family protein [Kitasatospora sp. NPDC094011]|uniref:endonuclease/exonuclease/phosphatase family protein n=1 Tax=Kitasatospora sp. NPDC094011 TaxID=3364090 RepID=UPI003802C544